MSESEAITIKTTTISEANKFGGIDVFGAAWVEPKGVEPKRIVQYRRDPDGRLRAIEAALRLHFDVSAKTLAAELAAGNPVSVRVIDVESLP